MVGSVGDITQRKRADERYRLVVESAPTAMVMVDRGGTIALVNRQTEQLFGYAREDLLGQRVDMLMPTDQRPGHQGHVDRYFQSPATLDPSTRTMDAGRELHGVRKDGSDFPIEICLTPINSGEGIMVLGAIVDITLRKQA